MPQQLSRAVDGRARGGAIACAALAVSCLALGGVFVRLSEVGPIATGGFRSLIAAPMLFLLSVGVGRRRGSRSQERMPARDHATIALGGLLLAIDLCLWNVSFLHTTLAESNLLANLVPFAAAIYGWVLFRDVPSARLIPPAILAIGGLLLLTPIGVHIDPQRLLGNAMALATAFFYTGFLVVAQGLRKRYPALRIMTILSLWCAAGCLAVAIARGENLLPRTARGWLLLVVLALTSQILGQTLMAHAMHFMSLQLGSLFALLQPVAAAAYAYVLFAESLTLSQLFGVAVLIASIYWAKLVLGS
ncbi:DMT family transporter [Actinomyces viscosus]|uniref:DMT family transporter n=1 Tax=Actinomyces viscosus TaxID=1656 RepID=UPI0028E78D5D|nr:DMT family transporter [Actinomyces viscosus]